MVVVWIVLTFVMVFTFRHFVVYGPDRRQVRKDQRKRDAVWKRDQ